MGGAVQDDEIQQQGLAVGNYNVGPLPDQIGGRERELLSGTDV